MPVEGPLPQTGDNQDIGADASRCFLARAPKDWRAHDPAGGDDYGLDYLVQTTPMQRVTDAFLVQLKGTSSPKISAGPLCQSSCQRQIHRSRHRTGSRPTDVKL